MFRRPLVNSTIFAVLIKCGDCKSIKDIDSTWLYRYEAQKRIDLLGATLPKGETLEVMICPLK